MDALHHAAFFEIISE